MPLTCSLESVHDAAQKHRPRRPIASDENHPRPSSPFLNISSRPSGNPLLSLICPLSTPLASAGSRRCLAEKKHPPGSSRSSSRSSTTRLEVAVDLTVSPCLLSVLRACYHHLDLTPPSCLIQGCSSTSTSSKPCRSSSRRCRHHLELHRLCMHVRRSLHTSWTAPPPN
jgi:hypothetical protein